MTTVQTPYRIEWRPKAREDLRAIVRYIAKDNPLRARTFGLELRNKTLPLADHPSLGRPGRPGLPAGVRELVVHRNYIVFYRALDAARTVEILRLKPGRCPLRGHRTPARPSGAFRSSPIRLDPSDCRCAALLQAACATLIGGSACGTSPSRWADPLG